ncbi:hypothetical protein [Nocardia colli]
MSTLDRPSRPGAGVATAGAAVWTVLSSRALRFRVDEISQEA